MNVARKYLLQLVNITLAFTKSANRDSASTSRGLKVPTDKVVNDLTLHINAVELPKWISLSSVNSGALLSVGLCCRICGRLFAWPGKLPGIASREPCRVF